MAGKHSRLEVLRERVARVDNRFKQSGVPNEQRIVAVVAVFIGQCNGIANNEPEGIFTAAEVADAIDDLDAIGKVVREDFVLKPDEKQNTWIVDAIAVCNDTEDTANDAAGEG